MVEFRKYLQTFHNDQEVCIQLLRGIQLYIKISSLIESDDNLEEARLILVKMVEIFL